jgi:N-acetylglucosaminyldiphosphoundecaprenol N-acetyl-beta-D-mannosaminyltransferase
MLEDNRTLRADAATADYETVSVADIDLAALSELEVEELVCDRLRRGKGGWLITANLEHLRQARADPIARDLVSRASVVVADGMPIVWAASLAGTPLRGRVAGSDLIWTLCRRAAATGLSVYLLGGPEGAAAQASERLRQMYSGLRVCGTWSPRVAKAPGKQEAQEIAERVAVTRPDIVFVGMGFPKQDLLIDLMRNECSATWFVGCGVSIEFVAGLVPRAPAWAQRAGLEWLYRLWREPRKLFARYIVHDIPYALSLAGWAVDRRIARSS